MERGRSRELEGTVLSQKMTKTVVVCIKRRVLHPIYKKHIVRMKKFYAHDDKSEAVVGDIVRIKESKPLSKLKRWRVIKVVKSVTR